ncbi:hypothetical protein NVS38_20800, partial [Enterobacter roggenkampii]
MQILTTHVGTTAMSHATALAFGRFSKYAPQVIMNLIEDNLFSVWNTTFNYCELNNHYGYYVPAELALYTVMSPNQQSFVDVNETEFGIIITQLFLVIILREGANKQVISSQADSLIKISRIWADFFPAK